MFTCQRLKAATAIVFLAVAVGADSLASATPVTITWDAATAVFDPSTATVTSWNLAGKEHIGTSHGLRFFYRIGDVGGQIGSAADGFVLNTLDHDPDSEVVSATYTLAGKFKASMYVSILAAGTSTSLLQTNLTIESDSTEDQNIKIFAFNDLDLANTSLDDSSSIAANLLHNIGEQADGGTSLADTILGGNGGNPGDANQGPTRWQADTAATLWASFSPGPAADLNLTASALSNDLAYAFQYNDFLRNKNAPSDSRSETMYSLYDLKVLDQPFTPPPPPVPEPLTPLLSLLGLGILALRSTGRP